MNHKSRLIGFYRWFAGSGLNLMVPNNCGDPFDSSHHHVKINTLDFEREVIELLGPLYGFDKDNIWGITTFSGTDGNNHGIYFGAKYLEKKTGLKPVVYVSESAHYSSMRLADLQNLDLSLIPSNVHGQMITEEFEKAFNPERPALVIYAMGTTFKGGIDDMKAVNAILEKHPDTAVFRHVDGALFGGYMPYTEYRDIVNRNVNHFDSIKEEFTEQAAMMLENAKWLKNELEKMGWPVWLEPMSNTVYFKRPAQSVVKKYDLAPDFDERLGGELSHVVVMQHVTKERLKVFLDDVKAGEI